MKNLLIAIGAFLGSLFNVHQNTVPPITTPIVAEQATSSVQIIDWATYSNPTISFTYPSMWMTPKEHFYGEGFWSLYYGGFTPVQTFFVSVDRDTDEMGRVLPDESLDQMVARFRKNDPYIYDVRDVSVKGDGGRTIQGKELFFKNAQTGVPLSVSAYFPLGTSSSYISISDDYYFSRPAIFEKILSSVELHAAFSPLNQVTGMAIYNNNGIRFEYPQKFNTPYASAQVDVSVEKLSDLGLDGNGCYPYLADSDSTGGKPSPISIQLIGSTKFCYAEGGGVGAGQRYSSYNYMTSHNGNAYFITYGVYTSNGCGVYKTSSDPASLESKKYDECLDFSKNKYGALVLKTIQQSIATLTFTE